MVGKAALGFGPVRIITLVSMATDSSHRVMMGENGVATYSRLFLNRSFLYLQITRTCLARMSSKFGQTRPPTAELVALERLKKIPYIYNGKKRRCHFFSAVFDRILFILKGNEGMGRTGAVVSVADYGPRGPWFETWPRHSLLWP